MIKVQLRSRNHDEARVVSAEFKMDMDGPEGLEKYKSALVSAMETECAWAEANDIIIGHLKAYAKLEDQALMFSTTGYGVQVKGSLEPGGDSFAMECGIDAITYGSALPDAEKRVEGLVAGVMAAFGQQWEPSYECDDPNCTDHHHHHHHDGECSCGHDHHEHEHGHGTHVKVHPAAHSAIHKPDGGVKPVKVHPRKLDRQQ